MNIALINHPITGCADRWAPPRFARQISIVAAKELRDALRNRWFLLYAVLFAVLTTALAWISMAGSGMDGMAGFGRTAAGLVNVVLLIVPLMALTVGAGTIAGERDRGTLEYLLAHPITRGELLFGKLLGSGLALIATLSLGFGISAIVVAWRGHAQQIGSFLTLVISTDLLALAMLSVGVLISVICRRSAVAVGVAILVWFALVFLTDLGLIGSTIAFRLQVRELFAAALANPMQVFKMSVLQSIHATLDVLGPAGAYAVQAHGKHLTWIFAGAGAAWIILPVGIAYILFARRSDA